MAALESYVGYTMIVGGRECYVEVLTPADLQSVVYVCVTPDGEFVPIESWRPPIAPPQLLRPEELNAVPDAELKEVFARVRDVVSRSIVFPDDKWADIVTAYIMYTWVRGLFHKNVNLYATGFPASGKSQILKAVDKMGRYPISYNPGSQKSIEWYLSLSRGVLLIDEMEYVSKSKLSILRKYHEEVFETKVAPTPGLGLVMAVLRVDAPIVAVSTHMPSDVAFLQRGFIIKMRKGSPEVKDIGELIDPLFRAWIAKNMWRHWHMIVEVKRELNEWLKTIDIDERAKDIALPIMTILRAVGFNDVKFVIDKAVLSIKRAYLATVENIVYAALIVKLRSIARKRGDYYVVKLHDVFEIAGSLAKSLWGSRSKLKYLIQYLMAGCEVKRDGLTDDVVLVCPARDVDAIAELFV